MSSENKESLSAKELWDLAGSDATITTDRLGVKNMNIEDGFEVITEGVEVLTFQHHSKKKD